MSEAEREPARAERRDVIESNKAWASAETVRRDWLRAYLIRKTAPKGTAAFIATALATDADLVCSGGDTALAADLIGCPATGQRPSPAFTPLAAQAPDG